MQVKQLNEGVWARTYLVICDETNKAAIIDPVWDYLDNYESHFEGLDLVYALSTHTHADHISGSFALSEKYGCPYVMHASSACLQVTQYVNDGDELPLGHMQLRFHHVPGHTSDSMIIEAGNHLFTGDFLFNGDGGVGRDDLPSGRLEDHWNSMKVMDRFSDEALVCSGHEPPGVDASTLGWNRENNPIFSLSSFDDYVQWQTESTQRLGAVSKIKVALPANIFAEVPENIPWLS